MDAQEIYDFFISLINKHIQTGTLPAYLYEMDLQPDTHLDDLGLDSISRVSLLTSLMDMADSYFPDSLFSGNPSLWQIAQRISDYKNNFLS